jgi:hypothetical protein
MQSSLALGLSPPKHGPTPVADSITGRCLESTNVPMENRAICLMSNSKQQTFRWSVNAIQIGCSSHQISIINVRHTISPVQPRSNGPHALRDINYPPLISSKLKSLVGIRRGRSWPGADAGRQPGPRDTPHNPTPISHNQ